MKSDLKRITQIASVYTGTVLGAGFASGQEMMQFFTSYGLNGIYGIVVTGIMFSIIGWAVLEIVYMYQIKDYKEFIYPMMGEFLGSIMEWAVSLFMLIGFCVMLAGTGALLEQRFNIPVQVGIILLAAACFLTFLFDVKGVIAINSIFAPLLLIGGILLGIHILVFRDVTTFSSMVEVFRRITHNWVTSSIVYISYNAITAVVVLCSLLPVISSKSVARWGGIMAGVALGFLGVCLGFATLINYGKIQGLEIPMLEIVMQYSPMIQYIYIFVLIAAMFTTAVANGYGFITRMSSILQVNKKIVMIIFIFVSIFIAQMGFSNMVKKIYPIFGYVGIFEIILILLYFFTIKIKSAKKRVLHEFQHRLDRMR